MLLIPGQLRTNIRIKEDILIVNIRMTKCLFLFYAKALGWKQMPDE